MFRKDHLAIIFINILAIVFFTILFLVNKNYEFIIYILVILFFFFLILWSHKKIQYPTHILVGLTIWAFLHMAGGGLTYKGTRLYEVMLIPLSATYQILKFDQFVHIVGFFVATLVVYHLLSPLLRPNNQKWVGLSIVVVMAGLGLGALNEIIEFSATIILPKTGVGGYLNTSLDLVSDLLGAILALVFIRMKTESLSPSQKRKG